MGLQRAWRVRRQWILWNFGWKPLICLHRRVVESQIQVHVSCTVFILNLWKAWLRSYSKFPSFFNRDFSLLLDENIQAWGFTLHLFQDCFLVNRLPPDDFGLNRLNLVSMVDVQVCWSAQRPCNRLAWFLEFQFHGLTNERIDLESSWRFWTEPLSDNVVSWILCLPHFFKPSVYRLNQLLCALAISTVVLLFIQRNHIGQFESAWHLYRTDALFLSFDRSHVHDFYWLQMWVLQVMIMIGVRTVVFIDRWYRSLLRFMFMVTPSVRNDNFLLRHLPPNPVDLMPFGQFPLSNAFIEYQARPSRHLAVVLSNKSSFHNCKNN